MINTIALWLELIGTPERAAKLQAAYANGNARGCPSVILLGDAGSRRAYADPRMRPALDSWDTGTTTQRDVRLWAAHVAKGGYDGPAYGVV